MTRTSLWPAAVIVATVIASLWFNAAQAQMACGTRDSVVAKLGKSYGETQRGLGVAGSTAIFEIWASNEPPYTWTLLRTMPNGLTCVIAVGNDWYGTPSTALTGNPV